MRRETIVRSAISVAAAAFYAVLTGLLAATPVFAQTYPDKPIRLIVTVAAGSFPDTVARVVGQKMSEGLGQPVVVDNRAGAGGNIGTEAVVTAKADGYTVLLHTVANACTAQAFGV